MTDQVTVKVECYGGLRTRVRADRFEVKVAAGSDVEAFLVHVLEVEPGLQGVMSGVAVAINDEIVGGRVASDGKEGVELREGDVVALLPPVSGGHEGRGGKGTERESGRWLRAEPLSLEALLEETADEECGGLVVFSGDIRRQNAGRSDVVAIEYEAHEAIASRELAAIEAEIRAKFGVREVRIQHRLGSVAVGESSVLVVCRAAHRAEAFEGARFGIDALKVRVPIWKKEHYADGSWQYLDGVPLK